MAAEKQSETLQSIAKAMVAPGRGILAADEGPDIMQNRFDAIHLANTVENRHAYRDLLFTTPDFAKDISAVILCDETFRQKSNGGKGVPFPELLRSLGVVVGITVDRGLVALAGCPGQVATAGLDGLRERAQEYYSLGARFAKWRAVVSITGTQENITRAIHVNAFLLASYAAVCQECGLVPIVEPEISMDGSHSAEECERVTRQTLVAVFDELNAQGVQLDGIVLKPSMAIAGSSAPRPAPDVVARLTLECFRATIPTAVPGIAFLSGGQNELESTAHLQLINAIGPHPWPFTFSYGRALQQSCRDAWQGKAENTHKAQTVFAHRAHMNGLASLGKYSPAFEAHLKI
eukprot:m.10387 g.10387  ORF g.10387 m.10387 type:complete len:348 (+) comp5595_c0_seq1:40-1083(+)